MALVIVNPSLVCLDYNSGGGVEGCGRALVNTLPSVRIDFKKNCCVTMILKGEKSWFWSSASIIVITVKTIN